MRKFAASFAILSLFLPGAVAGSEAQPELEDPEGDITYHPVTSLQGGHEWLDVLAAWFEYDPSGDQIIATLKTVDARGLSSPPSGWDIACSLDVDVMLEDARLGELTFHWEVLPSGPEIVTQVFYDGDRGGGTLEHLFEARLEMPGYFKFAINRTLAQNIGPTIENPRVYCYDVQLFVVVPGPANADSAEGRASYDWSLFHPDSPADGDEDVFPDNGSDNSSSMDGAADTPGFAADIVAVSIAVAAALVFARTRQRST